MTDQISSEVEEIPTEQVETQLNEAQDENKKQAKYKDGDILRFVRVRFPGNAKSFPFMIGSRNFQYGQKVIAPSDRGMALGYINSFPYEVEFEESMLPVKYINKAATDEDIEQDKSTYDKQKEAEVLAVELIEQFKLDMNLTHVEFTQFGKKTVFYFTAPNRVDFRQLVKDLVSKLKTRIELRQISVRDRAASIGGIGSCGRQLCCSSFLQKYGSATIKMAKNQNMMLAGNKINGVCGQLKCCIQYEDEVYSYKRKSLPKEGKFIQTANGDKGKVLKLEILSENFTMLTDKGVKRRYAADQFNKKDAYLEEGYRFPHRFDHISDETSTVITSVPTGEKLPDSSILDVFREQISTEEEKAGKNEHTPDKKEAKENLNNKNRSKRNSNRRRNNNKRNGRNESLTKNNHSRGDQSKSESRASEGSSEQKKQRPKGNSAKNNKSSGPKKDFVYNRRSK
jgi:cell fate regulator YaaT (PSP1 superfamily)